MTEDILATGLAAALGAAIAQAAAHRIAERRQWKRLPRYVTGLTIINVAAAPVLYVALPLDIGALLYAILWLIGGASGLATWLAYEADRRSGPAISDADLDRYAEYIAGEHRAKAK